jgi:Flp pilus assembly protein TadG
MDENGRQSAVRPARIVRRGQSAVEFALAGTVLIALLFGVLEIGRLMFINSEVENAAREGAQIVALNPNIQQGALTAQILSKMVVTDHSTVTVLPPCFLDSSGGCTGTPCPYCKVKVSVTARWISFVSFIQSVTLRSSSIKLIEGAQ